MAAQPQNLFSVLSSLHRNGDHPDLTVTCGSRQWKVHRSVLCSQSRFFESACTGDFLEAESGIVNLSEDEEEAVDHMIHYLYHLDYLDHNGRSSPRAGDTYKHRSNAKRSQATKIRPDLTNDPLFAMAAIHSSCGPSPPLSPVATPSVGRQDEHFKFPTTLAELTPPLEAELLRHSPGNDYFESTDDSRLLVHTQVYAVAEKYDIQPLKDLACQKFEIAMACYYDSPELADAIEEVYNSTVDSDRGLRNIIIQAFRSHPSLANTGDVYEVISRTPTLAFELWKAERGLPI